MDKVVLDSSATIALLANEPGHAAVEARLEGAALSTVNLAEVGDFLIRNNVGDRQRMARIVGALGLMIIDPDPTLALDASELFPPTRPAGLSLADRFCLALARRMNRPALTADRAWATIADAVGVRVELIR